MIAYEFIAGIPPFNDDTPDKIFNNILNRNIEWPPIGPNDDQMSQEAYDFINALLNPDPKQRLGSNGIAEIKKSSFFNCINWETLRDEPTPFKPNPNNIYDTTCFSAKKQEFSTEAFTIGSKINNETTEENEQSVIFYFLNFFS